MPIWRSHEPVALPPSPELRLLLDKDLSEASLEFPSGAMEIWLEGASRPIQWKKASGVFFVARKKNHFQFGGFNETLNWVELKPFDRKFILNGVRYEGTLRLLANGEDRFHLILVLEMEVYVAKVVDREMSPHWPLETLKAQAIAARSFAFYHKQKNEGSAYHLLIGPQAQALQHGQASKAALKVTFSTIGMVLKQNHEIYLAYYHSTCGGQTRQARQGNFDYSSVVCPHCSNSPYYHWSFELAQAEVETMLKTWLPEGMKLAQVKVIAEQSGHVQKVVFTPEQGPAIQMDALDFRRHINRHEGDEVIKSLKFDFHFNRGILKILGRGWGYHGLGMCQYGARALGEKLWTCRKILETYYPDTSIEWMPYLEL